MTTPAAAVAEYWRLKPLIRRVPPGWKTPVTVQEWAPNAPRYSWATMGPVDHCGLSMNTLLHNIGLVFDQDYPNCAWTPSARAWADTQSPVAFADIQPGDLLLYRDAGSAYTATHIGIALEAWDGGGVVSGEFNTDPDGMGREYRRTPPYLVAAGRPAYTPTDLANPVEQQVYDWAKAQGLSDAGAAGIMGNFLAESAMDPGIVEGGSHDLADLVPGVREGIGLLQWSYSRREALLAYAAAVGKPWQDAATQLDFMLSEINAGYGAMWAGLQLASDPRAASRLFAETFVRPGVYGPRDDHAADYHARILAGDFGTPTPPPLPPPYVPVHLDVYPSGDDMATTLIIDIPDAPEGIPGTWEYTGVNLAPFPDASLSGDYERQSRSYGAFLPLFARYLTVYRLGLDGVPLETQLRNHAKEALEKFNASV